MLLLLYLKVIPTAQGHGSCLLYYLLGGFQFCVLHLVLWCIFCRIFVNYERSVYIHFAYACQLFQNHLLKGLTLLYFVICLLSKISWSYLCRPISGLSIIFHWSVCLIFPWYYSILITVASSVEYSKLYIISSPTLFFFLNILLAFLDGCLSI